MKERKEKHSISRKWFPKLNTYRYFKFGEGGHVNDTHSLLTAFDFRFHNVKPVWLVESLALL